jgi:hypothetical protein
MFSKILYKYKNSGVKTMKQWSVYFGIDINVLRHRWNKGVRGDDLLKAVPLPTTSYSVYVTYDTGSGEERKTLKEWAEEFGVDPKTLASRYAMGKRENELFKPVSKYTKPTHHIRNTTPMTR